MKSFAIDELHSAARFILNTVSEKTLLFFGEMGVGKTTLIKELVKQLNSEDRVSSPTFSLVNEYHTLDGDLIYHFDFYRIKSEVEALDMGIEDYFSSGNWCFIEWPEKVKNLLPLNAAAIHLNKNADGTRSISIK